MSAENFPHFVVGQQIKQPLAHCFLEVEISIRLVFFEEKWRYVAKSEDILSFSSVRFCKLSAQPLVLLTPHVFRIGIVFP